MKVRSIRLSAGTVAAVSLLLAGCDYFGADQVRSVPEASAPSAPLETALAPASEPRQTRFNDLMVDVSSGNEGELHTCIDFERGAIEVQYGAKGVIQTTLPDGTRQTGYRYQIKYDTGKAGLQFSMDQAPRWFQVTQSQGMAAETLSDLNSGAVKLRCFKRFQEQHLWFDFDLETALPYLTRSWTCQGSLGPISIGTEGAIVSSFGQGQAFLWRDGHGVYMSTVLVDQKTGRYGPAAEYALDLSKITHGELSYRGAGQNKPAHCKVT